MFGSESDIVKVCYLLFRSGSKFLVKITANTKLFVKDGEQIKIELITSQASLSDSTKNSIV